MCPASRRTRLVRPSSTRRPTRGRSTRPSDSAFSGRGSRAVWPLPAQILVEEVERPLPRELGGGFVVARRRVVVEAVLRSLVHERLVLLAVRFQRRLERRPS